MDRFEQVGVPPAASPSDRAFVDAFTPRALRGIHLNRSNKWSVTYQTTPATRIMVDGTAYFTPVEIAKGGRIAAARVRTSIAATGGSGTRSKVGLYHADPVTLRPTGAPFHDFGVIDLTTVAGTVSVTAPAVSPVIDDETFLVWACMTNLGYTGQCTINSQHGESRGYVDTASNVVTPAAGYSIPISGSANLPTIVDANLVLPAAATVVPSYAFNTPA